MDLIAALFALGCVAGAYVDTILVRRIRSAAQGELATHLRARFTIQVLAFSAAAVVFLLSAVTTSPPLFLDGVYVMMIVPLTTLVFRVVRPRH